MISECLSMREYRLGEQHSFDDAERELKKELFLVENVKSNSQTEVKLLGKRSTHWKK